MPDNNHNRRETILEIGKRMFVKNLVAANSGNISTRLEPDNLEPIVEKILQAVR